MPETTFKYTIVNSSAPHYIGHTGYCFKTTNNTVGFHTKPIVTSKFADAEELLNCLRETYGIQSDLSTAGEDIFATLVEVEEGGSRTLTRQFHIRPLVG